jgi:hypothetical protein
MTISVSDPHWLYEDSDTDLAFYTNADPDPVRIWILVKSELSFLKVNKTKFFVI